MNNSFDTRYDIRIANVNDIPAIMEFIKENWNATHIMASNRDFFSYEFVEDDGTVNFILAIDKKKETIEAIYGYLKASHDKDCLDIWGSFLKTRENNLPLLGMELIKRRPGMVGCRNDIGVGANPSTTIPLMKLLRRHTAKMDHYYMLSDRADFKIAQIIDRPHPINKVDVQCSVIKLDSIEEIREKFDASQYKAMSPYKDYWYIEHRFLKHPIYKYDVYGIVQEEEVETLLVLRKQQYNQRVAVRFVDCIGNKDLLAGTYEFWHNLLKEEDNEYADFYCSGFPAEIVEKAGFVLLEDNSRNIIPNYFSPYEARNIDIWVQSTSKDTSFTKADGDQDRPN